MQQINTPSKTARKYYPGITLFKLIGSILVVFTHIGLPNVYAQLNKSIIGLHSFVAIVVPCFYIISGFLAYQGWSNSKYPRLYIKRYVMWIGSVYLLFLSYYILEHVVPLFIHYGFVRHLIFSQAVKILDIFFITGPNAALWFIPPLIFGTICCYYLHSTRKLSLAAKLAVASFIITLCMYGTLRMLLESIYGNIAFLRNTYVNIGMAVFYKYAGFGFTFVFAGTLLGKYENKFLQLKAPLFMCLTMILVVMEIALLNYIAVGYSIHYFVFSMIPLSVLAFYGILKVKANWVYAHHKLLNTFTVITFFCHIYFIDINIRVLGYHLNGATIQQTTSCLLLTLIEASVVTSVIVYVQKSFKIPVKKLLSFA
jgi:hypothetical protein